MVTTSGETNQKLASALPHANSSDTCAAQSTAQPCMLHLLLRLVLSLSFALIIQRCILLACCDWPSDPWGLCQLLPLGPCHSGHLHNGVWCLAGTSQG
jgi:hypothetical protein